MPIYPNPAGGSMVAANDQQAAAQGWSPSMGTFGNQTYPDGGGGGSSSGGGGGAPTTVNASSGQLAGGINSLMGAIASGNKQAFDEAVRQFNATFGLDKDKFTEAVRQFNQNYLLSEAGATGYYQRPGTAAPTPLAGYPPGTVVRTDANQFGVVGANGLVDANPNNPAIQQAIQAGSGIVTVPDAAFAAAQPTAVPTMAREQQTYAQQMGMINAAAAMQANPFRQQQAIGQMNNLLGGQGVAGFSAPNTVGGVGVAGGNTQGGMGYLQAMIDDIRDPSANTASMNQIMQGIPTPNKLNSTEFLQAAPSTQSLVLQGMQEKYGIDPNDALAQIKATLPAFQAPTTFGQVKR